MKLVHKYLAWSIGIWLMLICVSGSILLFKNDLLPIMYKELASAKAQYEFEQMAQDKGKRIDKLAQVTAQFDQTSQYRYVIYASTKAPWHLVVDELDTHHYYDLNGTKLLSRSNDGDWLEWLRQFHLHLLLHELGEDILGVLTIVACILVAAGLLVWWPRRFSRRIFVLPTRTNHSKTYRQWHTVLGVFSLPLLAVVLFTSIGLLYFSGIQGFLTQFFDKKVATPTVKTAALNLSSLHPQTNTNWQQAFEQAITALPEADLRLLSLQQAPSALMNLRMKFPQEWHPNGRTRVYFHPHSGNLVKIQSALEMGPGEWFMNLLYPIHIAAVGGYWWMVTLSVVGLIPVFLMYFGFRLGRLSKAV